MKRAQHKKFLKALGNRIRGIRKEQKISQSQLAFESEMPREQISRIELGKQGTSIINLLLIAESLNIALQELFDFEY